jgi:diamine N-acetyltransferase
MQNEKIKLRALEPEDLELLYLWENDTSIWKISNTYAPFSKYTLEKYLAEAHLDIFETKQLRLIIDKISDGNVKSIGAIDLFDYEPYHQRAGIGILIAEDVEKNKGYGNTSLDLFLKYCFSTLGLHQVYCNIGKDNSTSIKLFKNLGFTEVGIKKDWIRNENGWEDEIILQKINPTS